MKALLNQPVFAVGYIHVLLREGMKIRQATNEDIPKIQCLYQQLDEHHVNLLPDIFQSVEGDARPDSLIEQWIANKDADYLIAELGGEIVGFINVQKSSHPKYPGFRPHDFAMIENAVVDKVQRGKGIGRALFQAAVSWANDRDLRYIQVTVWNENSGAREFYLDQGFRPLTIKMELDTEKNAEQENSLDPQS